MEYITSNLLLALGHAAKMEVVNAIVIAKVVASNIMKHGIKQYSFGQASRFVLVTLVTGTGIGLSVSLVASFLKYILHAAPVHPIVPATSRL